MQVSIIKIKTYRETKKEKKKTRIKAQSIARQQAVQRKKFKWSRKDLKSQPNLEKIRAF